MEIVYNRDIILIVSRNQAGKTTLAKNLIEKIPKEDVIILDTQNSFQGYPNRLFPIRHTPEVLNKFILKCRTFTNKMIVLDDVDVFKPRYANDFYDLVVTNAHQGLGVIMTAKRVLWLDKVIIQNAHYLIFSSFIPVEDKEYIDKMLGKGVIKWSKIDKLPLYTFMVYDNFNNKFSIIKTHVVK